ncbi:MAG: LytTR family transcriptional regulator [Eubacterium sp.]|nr:LytTR family transcriptional regulator [Eubacterium sp.]
MIKAAVFDNNIANRNSLKQIIIKYTAQRNINIDVFWFFDDFGEEKIKEYAPSFNIAFISTEADDKYRISRTIYEINEDCRIVYYSSSATDLEPMLSVRTRAFHLSARGETALIRILDDIINELKISRNNFYYETRREIFVIPYSNILYFQSDLKYINIHIKNKETERIYTKLSLIESSLNTCFLRIHKSYILNSKYVSRIDKSNKTVILKNGEVLPISDVNYKAVINYFAEREREYE